MLKQLIIKIFLIITLFCLYINNAYSINLHLTGSISETYDDNINSSEEKESDFITAAIFGLGLMHDGKSFNWHLLGESTQQIYFKNNNFNNNSQRVELGIAKEIRYNDRFSISDIFAHYPEPRDFEYMFGLSSGRTGYYANTFISTYSNNLLRYFFITFGYTNSYTKALSNESADSMSNIGRVEIGYEITPSNILSVFYSYTYLKILEDREVGSNKTILNTGGLGYQHYFTRQLFSNLQFGLEHIKTEEKTNYNTSIIASITDQINEKNNLNLSISRQYEITPLTNEAYDIWNYTINFTRELSPLSSFSISCFYQYGNTVSSNTTIKSKLLGIRTFFNYNFSENISSNISYIYTYNKSTQLEPITNNIEYNRNQIEIAGRAIF